MSNYKRFFCVGAPLLRGSEARLEGDECYHLKKVLRMRAGERLILCNGDGKDYVCLIEGFAEDSVLLRVVECCENQTETSIDVTLFQAVIKGKMDYVVQKATESGVRKIIPFESRFTVAKGENIVRLNKIVVESGKQCGRAFIPEVTPTQSFDNALVALSEYEAVLFCNERERNMNLLKGLAQVRGCTSLAVVVGCEGGFTEDEESKLKQISVSVSLGRRILRADTASVCALSVINAFFEADSGAL
ncbi:MAG: RsmE family RNA methyltransferase [Clostridia bacterium]|nr:RsmE family RNA methyltransferase [Clostridia bacterium]